MKFDMHCHTAEGSPDAKVSIVDYAAKLKKLGYSGMLISDHDSYKGYKAYKKSLRKYCPSNFTILRGIEYDTIDAGHILVIMPAGKHLKILEYRGLPVYVLIDIVHKNGGILGPAHPFGERYLSIFNTGIFRFHNGIASQFDFIEVFNACEDGTRNDKANSIADKYSLSKFGGSDAHKYETIGKAYTEFPDNIKIRNENDLIEYIKADGKTNCGGERFYGTTKDKLGKLNHILVQSFWLYNKGLGLAKKHKRTKELKNIFKLDNK